MRVLLWLTLFTLGCHLLAEEDISTKATATEKGFAWVWDYQEPDYTTYPITRHYFWESPSYLVQFNASYGYIRSQNDDRTHDYFYNVIFRPFVFSFSDANTISAGISAFGVYQDLEGEELDEGVDGDFASGLYNYSIGPSILFSFPSLGVQYSIEFTYYWQKLTFTTDEFPLDLGGIIIDVPVRNTQRERGIGVFSLFNYFVDRLFLYGFEWATTVSFPHSKRRVDTRVAGIEVAQKETETFFIDSLLFIRGVAVPIYNDWRISFDPIIGATHIRVNRGFSLNTGLRLNILEGLKINTFYSFEQSNDEEDSFNLFLEVTIAL